MDQTTWSYDVPISPKVLREALCLAQTYVGQSRLNYSQRTSTLLDLQVLIDECDRHRPLGIDGKHSNLHTETCGCLDKGDPSTWGTVKKISATPRASLERDVHWYNYAKSLGMNTSLGGVRTTGIKEEVTCSICLDELKAESP